MYGLDVLPGKRCIIVQETLARKSKNSSKSHSKSSSCSSSASCNTSDNSNINKKIFHGIIRKCSQPLSKKIDSNFKVYIFSLKL